jgi:hypothetical protein
VHISWNISFDWLINDDLLGLDIIRVPFGNEFYQLVNEFFVWKKSLGILLQFFNGHSASLGVGKLLNSFSEG